MRRGMIDIETIGPAPHGAVIAIGACTFTLDGGVGDGFEVLIRPEDAKAHGVEDAATRDWWSRQDPAVRIRMFSGESSLRDALDRLSEFVKRERWKEVWANSPSFDLTILRHAYKQTGRECPWHFRDERDVRTVYAEARELGISLDGAYSGNVKHDARSDAEAQARGVIAAKRGKTPRLFS